MLPLSCALSAYPAHLRPTNAFKSSILVPLSSRISVSARHHHHPFAPEVMEAVDSLYSEFRSIDNLVARNTTRVLNAYQNAQVASQHFGGCTGYGHDEAGGRAALDTAFAEIVGAESAIVRAQFFSGTHAIACALFALLRPGDELLAVAGAPYDTLEEVIGIRDSGGLGSLKDYGVTYREVPLAEDGGLNWNELAVALSPQTRCALIQRSCGYSWRRSLSIKEIGKAIKMIKVSHTYGIDIVQPVCVIIDGLQPRYLIEHIYLHKNKKNAISPLYPLCSLDSSPSNSSCKVCLVGSSSPHSTLEMQNPDCMVLVDNCYGEFVESMEPPMVGADLIAGSLIKNPGGTVAPCGGYVAGRKKWVEAAAARLSAPGLGIDCGSTPGDIMRLLFQGLFLSPQMVGEAIKGSFLIAEVMASKSYKVQPLPRVPRHDTVQAVQLGTRERLLAFCEAVQRSCPVGSFIKPIAGSSPGYASEVVFAHGTFIDGSTSELSCDGPLREPYSVFCQCPR